MTVHEKSEVLRYLLPSAEYSPLVAELTEKILTNLDSDEVIMYADCTSPGSSKMAALVLASFAIVFAIGAFESHPTQPLFLFFALLLVIVAYFFYRNDDMFVTLWAITNKHVVCASRIRSIRYSYADIQPMEEWTPDVVEFRTGPAETSIVVMDNLTDSKRMRERLEAASEAAANARALGQTAQIARREVTQSNSPAPSMVSGAQHNSPAPSVVSGAQNNSPAPSVVSGEQHNSPAPAMVSGVQSNSPAPPAVPGAHNNSPAPSTVPGAQNNLPAPSVVSGAQHNSPSPHTAPIVSNNQPLPSSMPIDRLKSTAPRVVLSNSEAIISDLIDQPTTVATTRRQELIEDIRLARQQNWAAITAGMIAGACIGSAAISPSSHSVEANVLLLRAVELGFIAFGGGLGWFGLRALRRSSK